MSAKLCVVCGDALPLLRRADRRYCGGRCQVRAHRIRVGHQDGKPHVLRRTGPPADGEDAILVNDSVAALDVLQQQLDEERALRRQLEITVAELREQFGRVEAERAATHQKSEQHLSEAQSTKAELVKVQDMLAFYKQQVQSLTRINANLCKQAAIDKKPLTQNRVKVARAQEQERRRVAAQEKKAEQRESRIFAKQMEASERQCAKLGHAQPREAADTGESERIKRALLASQQEVRHLQMKQMSQAPRDTKPGESILATLGTALLEGLVAGVGHKAGEVLTAGTRGIPRRLPAPAIRAEVVKMVPDTNDSRQRPLMPPETPKSEGYCELINSETEDA